MKHWPSNLSIHSFIAAAAAKYDINIATAVNEFSINDFFFAKNNIEHSFFKATQQHKIQ